MHPRNPYCTPPDFSSLADFHPPLKAHLITDPLSGRNIINFKNEDAQRRLTEAIMLRDFGVVMKIPEGRLCPPVPNRMNYVLWIQDIIYAHQDVLGTSHRAGSSSGSGSNSSSPSTRRKTRGLDIGTGSTAIYPILACKSQNQSWSRTGVGEEWEMVGTELDDLSYAYAQENVSANLLEGSIKILKASADGPILFPVEEQTFDFCMCNPPFYASKEEIEQSAVGKEMPPNAVCTGAPIEMIYCDGGEAGFVGRMVEESVRLGVRCKWYTSMLGKMSSVSSIVQALKAHSVTNYGITEFVQGQTRRWGVAWSFTDERLPDAVARIPSINPKHPLYALMPPRNTLVQPLASSSLLPSASEVKVGMEVRVGVDVEKVLEEVLQDVAGVSVTKRRTPTSSSAVLAHARIGSSSSPTTTTSAAAPSAPSASAFTATSAGSVGTDEDASAAGDVGVGSGSGTAGLGAGETMGVKVTAPVAFLVEAQENTWSRSARRKNRRPTKAQPSQPELQQPQSQQPRPQQSEDLDPSQPSSSKLVSRQTPTPTTARAKAMQTQTKPEEQPIKPTLTCSCRVVRRSSSFPQLQEEQIQDRDGERDGGGAMGAAGVGAGVGGVGGAAAAGGLGGDAFAEHVHTKGGGTSDMALEFQWIYGTDRALYESFVGHVGRKVGAALALKSRSSGTSASSAS